MDVCTTCVSKMPGPLPVLLGLACLGILLVIAVLDNVITTKTR